MADLAPIVGRVRIFAAPVNRTTGAVLAFDAAANGRFALTAPPTGWTDLGWVTGFDRTSNTTMEALSVGAPAIAATQAVTAVGARVSMDFGSWSRLAMALASSGQTVNLLRPGFTAAAIGTGSTATVLQLGSAVSGLTIGDRIAVDADYTGVTGWLGAGWPAAYVASAPGSTDADFLRKNTLNVGRVASITGGTVTLEAPLLAGLPTAGMKAAPIAGFGDRCGGPVAQAWSALCVMEGVQGDRIVVLYPWLEACAGAAEADETLEGILQRVRLRGEFRALPVADADGTPVVAWRWYLP